MPLSPTRLASDIRTRLLANPDAMAVDNTALTALCSEIAAAVVAELIMFGVIIPSSMAAPPGTAGGPIIGTGSIS